MAEPTEDEIEAHRLLVARLGGLGFVLPGSLVARHTRCGNHNCHCYSEPPELHGPYLQWPRTEANKTVSRIWSDESSPAIRPGSTTPAGPGAPSASSRHLPSRSWGVTSAFDLLSRHGRAADHRHVIRLEAVTRPAERRFNSARSRANLGRCCRCRRYEANMRQSCFGALG